MSEFPARTWRSESPSRNPHIDDVYANSIRSYMSEIRVLKDRNKKLEYHLKNDESRISELSDIIDNLRNEKDSIIQQLRQTEYELREAEKHAHETKKEVTYHSSEVHSQNIYLQQEVQRYKDDIDNFKAQFIELQNTHQDAVQAQKDMSSKLKSTKSKYQEAKQSLESANEQLKASQQRQVYMEQNMANMQLKVNKYKTRSKELQQQLAIAEAHIKETSEASSILKKRVQSIEEIMKQNNKNNSELTAKETEIENLRREKESENLLHITEIENLKREKNIEIQSILKDKSYELETLKREKDAEILLQKNEIDRYKQQISDLNQKFMRMENENMTLIQKCQTITDALAHAQKQIEETKKDCDVALSAHQQANSSQINILNDMISDLEYKNRELEDQLAMVQEDLEHSKKQLSDTNQQFHETLQITRSTHQDQLKKLNLKLEKSQALCNEFSRQLISGDSSDQDKMDLAESRAKVATLQSENNAYRETISTMQQQFQQFKELYKFCESRFVNSYSQTDENEKLKQELVRYKKIVNQMEHEHELLFRSARSEVLPESIPETPLTKPPLKTPKKNNFSPSKRRLLEDDSLDDL